MEEQVETSVNKETFVDEHGVTRYKDNGQIAPGNTANPNGRPPETPETRMAKKATKQLIKDYQEKLAEALVKIEPVLVAKALEGDVQAIKELHDRAMGKALQKTDITTGGKPMPIFGGQSNAIQTDNGD